MLILTCHDCSNQSLFAFSPSFSPSHLLNNFSGGCRQRSGDFPNQGGLAEWSKAIDSNVSNLDLSIPFGGVGSNPTAVAEIILSFCCFFVSSRRFYPGPWRDTSDSIKVSQHMLSWRICFLPSWKWVPTASFGSSIRSTQCDNFALAVMGWNIWAKLWFNNYRVAVWPSGLRRLTRILSIYQFPSGASVRIRQPSFYLFCLLWW